MLKRLSVTRESWVSPKTTLSDSTIHGRGLVARDPIAADELVAIKGGRLLTLAQFRASPVYSRHTELQVADDLVIAALTEEDVDRSMVYANHSCEPNMGLREVNEVVAIKDVEPGDELTVDYGTFVAYDGFSMTCGCGSDHCRGQITNQDWRLPDVRERMHGYFPDFVAEKLDHLAEIAGRVVVEIDRNLTQDGTTDVDTFLWWMEPVTLSRGTLRTLSRRDLVSSGNLALLAIKSPEIYRDNDSVYPERLSRLRDFQREIDDLTGCRGRLSRPHLECDSNDHLMVQLSPLEMRM